MPNDIDNKTYYSSKNITIFPSSNAVDGGKIYTENNGRNVTINITDLNYVVSPNPGGYDISNTGTEIEIQPGKAIINGFEILTDATIQYRYPTAEEITSTGYYSGYALLCLHTNFDALDNICGNVMVETQWVCTGINIQYVGYTDYLAKPNEYLLLGGVKEDGTVKINKDKFDRIDSKYIHVNIEEDPETHRPPTQTTNLNDFINNYLKGYWVSKAGDNEYGPLIFKSEPTGYNIEGFDYKTEDALTSVNYSVKISKQTINNRLEGYIYIKNEPDADINKNTFISPNSLWFFKGQNSNPAVVDVEGNEKANITLTDSDTHKLDKLLLNSSRLIQLSAGLYANPDNSLQFVLGNETNKGNIAYVTYPNNVDDERNNYLWDIEQNISTENYTRQGTEYVVKNKISLSAKDSTVRIKSTKTSDTDSDATVEFINGSLDGTNTTSKLYISSDTYNNKPTLATSDNLTVGLNNIVRGYIYAGSEDANNVTVPDYANGGVRKLKPNDIYGSQVWSAVYNDLAEVFDLDPEFSVKDVAHKIIAVTAKEKYIVADRYNTKIIGIVSENPAYCCGGKDCKNGVPVALAGRVTVMYEGKKPNIGDFVGLSKKTPGYATKCKHNGKLRCGKITKIIDNSKVEVIVLL